MDDEGAVLVIFGLICDGNFWIDFYHHLAQLELSHSKVKRIGLIDWS